MSDPHSHPVPLRVRCPRCGYDQRGVIETWKESCPLDGVCSECGLRIEWPELLSNKVKRPKWNVECAKRSRSVPWRSLTTLAMSLRPRRFWTSLQMHHAISPGRLIAYIACLMFAAYLLFATMQVAITIRFWSDIQAKGITAGWGTAIPATPQVGLVSVVMQALIMPLSHTSPGTVLSGPAKWDYPAPASIAPSVGTDVTFGGKNVVWQHVQYGWYPLPLNAGVTIGRLQHRTVIARYFYQKGGILRFAVTVLIISCAAFLLLPQTRKQCKVRFAHVVRIGAYASTFLLAGTSSIITHDQVCLAMLSNDVSGPVMWFNIWFLLWPPIVFFWWGMATKHYLRMPHAWGIAAAVTIVGCLVALLAGSLSTVAWMVT